MSRSYKRKPCIVQGTKSLKRDANRVVRYFKGEIGQHCFYKRLYESYDIRDWVWYCPEELVKNKKYRQAARIIRKIFKGKLKAEDYNLEELLEQLQDGKHSFEFTNK